MVEEHPMPKLPKINILSQAKKADVVVNYRVY